MAGTAALPTGGAYVAGSGTINQSGSTLTVNQNSARGVINWQDFSIGAGQSVQFNNGSGATLNRVIGGNISSIYGSLKASGTVYLVNPQGIVVGPTGVIKTGGSFVASTHDISNSQFMAGGSLVFQSDSDGQVVNLGQIASVSGDVILIAQQVSNSGTISAPNGTAALAAGSQVILSEASGSGGKVAVTGTGSLNNQGVIEAAQAELRAAGGNIYALAGNNGGVVRATGVQNLDGHVWLTAGNGPVSNSGTLAAANADGSGGTVTVQATQGAVSQSGTIAVNSTTGNTNGGTATVTGTSVALTNGSLIDASGAGNGGTVLVGGGFHGANTIAHATQVSMASGAVIKADGGTGAAGTGNGGSVALWSDQATRFDGLISAQGGTARGNGGFVETSSAKTLSVRGMVNTKTRDGKAGTWLLDPSDITITNDGTDSLNGNNSYDPSASYGTIAPATIVAGLGYGDVMITTSSGFGGSGTITVADPITWNTHYVLSLQASGPVIINAAITGTVGTLDLMADPGQSITQTAPINVDSLSIHGGVATLTNSGNSINTLALQNVGATSIRSNTSMTVGTAWVFSGITARGNLALTVGGTGNMLTISSPITNSNPSGTMTFTADRMSIAANVDTFQNTMILQPFTSGWGMNIGSTTDIAANTLEISNAEYNHLISTNPNSYWTNVQFGSSTTGPIVISDAISNLGTYNSSHQQSNIALVSGSTISETGSGAITAQYLRLTSGGAVTMNGANVLQDGNGSGGYLIAHTNNSDMTFHANQPVNTQLSLGSGAVGDNIDVGTGTLTLKVDAPYTSGNTPAHVNLTNSLTARSLALYGPNVRWWMYGQPLHINTLAGNTGTLALYGTGSYSIGTVGSYVGLTSVGIGNTGGVPDFQSLGLETGGTVTQTAPIQVYRLFLGDGNFDLENSSNHVNALTEYSYSQYSATSGANVTGALGTVTYVDSGSFQIANNVNQLAASGPVSLTAAGNISTAETRASSQDNDRSTTSIASGGSLTLRAGSTVAFDTDLSGNGVSITSGGNTTLGGQVNGNSGGISVVAGNTGTGNITLNNAAALNATGTAAIILAAQGGNFLNTTGGAVLHTTSGRWLVYSTSPGQNQGQPTNAAWTRYLASYTGVPPGSTAAGNGLLYTTGGPVTPTPPSVTPPVSPRSLAVTPIIAQTAASNPMPNTQPTASGGPVTMDTSSASGTGGQMAVSVNAGSFNVVYQQPAGYRPGSSATVDNGGRQGGTIASGSSFDTFASGDHPSLSVSDGTTPKSRTTN